MTEKESNTTENTPQSDYLSKIISEVMASADESSQNATVDSSNTVFNSHTSQPANSSPSSTDFISSILSNPELLSKLPTLLSSIKPIMDMFGRSQTVGAIHKSEPEDQSIPASSQAISAAKTKGDSGRRAALLCAMKPYLNHERQNTIDYIIKLSKLSDVLKSL